MISKISRNRLAPVIEFVDRNGKLLTPPRVDFREPIKPEYVSQIYEVIPLQSEGWAELALTYLEDARFWWVIADLSGIVDPFTELEEGKPLICTTAEAIYTEILP